MLKPLEGIKVVDFTLAGSGPSGTMVLQDLGADVIWVEPLGGNSCRTLHELPYYCGGKRSITLNLKDSRGIEAMYKLIAQADVFCTNYRSKAVKKLGLSYDKLKEINPKLIYAALTGWGDNGPKANDPGFDTVCFWARGGLLQDIAEKGSLVVPPVAIADIFTGESMAFGVMTGLFHRERTGEGCNVTTSILMHALFGNHDAMVEVQYGEKYPKTRLAPRRAMLNTYQCGDGKWFVFLLSSGWEKFDKILEIIGRSDLIGDPRWTCFEDTMYEHAPELVRIFDEAFGKMTRDEVLEKFTAADIACEAVNTTTDTFSDPQVLENGYLRPWVSPHNHQTYMFPLRVPLQFGNDVSAPEIKEMPRLGQHSEEILGELGYSGEEIRTLMQDKVTNCTDIYYNANIDLEAHFDYSSR